MQVLHYAISSVSTATDDSKNATNRKDIACTSTMDVALLRHEFSAFLRHRGDNL